MKDGKETQARMQVRKNQWQSENVVLPIGRIQVSLIAGLWGTLVTLDPLMQPCFAEQPH